MASVTLAIVMRLLPLTPYPIHAPEHPGAACIGRTALPAMCRGVRQGREVWVKNVRLFPRAQLEFPVIFGYFE